MGDVQRFAETLQDEDGPDLQDLRIDVATPFNSTWNMAVRDLLVQDFLGQQRISDWDLRPRSRAYLEEMISNRLHRIWTTYRSAQPHVSETGHKETANEVGERVAREIDEDLRKSRHTSRRHDVS